MATIPKVSRAYRTYAYTSFKKEFSLLSRLHWYFSYSAEISTDEVVKADPSGTSPLTSVRPVTKMDGNRLSISTGQFVDMQTSTIAHLRAILLVKGIASLEDYIHRYCSYYGVYRGYVGDRPNRLSDVGDALIAPAMKSSLKPVLSYVSSLMGLDFGAPLSVVAEAYQIRCAVAHNGGVVDSETVKKVPRLKKHLGQRILLTWDELQAYLNGIDKVACQIDQAIPQGKLNSIEARWLIQDAVDSGKKLSAFQIRHQLATIHGIKSMPRASEIAAEFQVPLGAPVVHPKR